MEVKFQLTIFKIKTWHYNCNEIQYINSYNLVDMNTSILFVESQAILNRITGFKSKNILVRIQGKNAQGAVRMMRLARV